jgi:hypothetical protein
MLGRTGACQSPICNNFMGEPRAKKHATFSLAGFLNNVALCSYLQAATIANMTMSKQHLEARLSRIEQELANLRAAIPRKSKDRWYRQIVGDFVGDEAFAEIVRLGRRKRRGNAKVDGQ